ncbi:MAG: hypothetical protein ABSA82_06240 [Thermacetogeniaceae bacterium]
MLSLSPEQPAQYPPGEPACQPPDNTLTHRASLNCVHIAVDKLGQILKAEATE